MAQSERCPPSDPADASRAYWVDRANATAGAAAVLPAGRWLRYHAWTLRLLQAWTLGRLDRPRYRRMLDLGCGRGEWSALFAPRVDEVHACDVAPEFATQTRARLDAIGHTSWNVTCADLRNYRMPRAIDLVYAGGVLTYFSDATVRELLRELRASLAPNALVIVRDYCTFNLGHPSVNTQSGYSLHRRPADIVALAERAGLRCLEARPSPSIYAEQLGNRFTRWPLALAWRLATAHWLRASHTFVLFAA